MNTDNLIKYYNKFNEDKRINHRHKNPTLSNSALSFFAKANELQIKIHDENNVSSNVWDTIYF